MRLSNRKQKQRQEGGGEREERKVAGGEREERKVAGGEREESKRVEERGRKGR